jgi:hypothetical protein
MTKKVSSSELLQKLVEDNQELKNEMVLLKDSIAGQMFDLQKKTLQLRQKAVSKNDNVVQSHEIKENFSPEKSREKIITMISDKSKKISELEEKLKIQENTISDILLQKEATSKLINSKNEQILLQKSELATLHFDKLKLKQEINSLLLEMQKVKGKENFHVKKFEQLSNDIKNQKEQFDILFAKNIVDLNEKDSQMLSQGQNILSLKNKINELLLENKNLSSKISLQKETYEKLKEQMQSIGRLFVSKDGEVKSAINAMQSELEKYKKIACELKANNEQLLLDVNKYSDQAKKYRKRSEEFEVFSAKKQESKQLDVIGREQLSIQAYNQNKEIEILKQTILELTHKLKTRKIDEAKVLELKDQDFDTKLKQLTEEYSKKEIELEYKLEDLRKENQALHSDMELLKQKGQQMLESIKNQFNTLL